MAHQEAQCADAVLMMRPACFGFNSQTAASNAFQAAPLGDLESGPAGVLQTLALREFEQLGERLGRAGVQVLVAEDSALPIKPDAIFPNNWVSFHRDGTVVLYPMLAPNRRSERRQDVVQQIARQGSYRTSRTVDLSHREQEGKFLEGTGSMVLDRPNRVAYACLSPRTDLDVLGEFAQQLDYELVTFEAVDGSATPVYHTNVLMAIGSRFAVLCGEALSDPAHAAAVAEKLRATDHEVIEISRNQMQQFAGNLLELAPAGGPIIAMSTTAWRSFDTAQRRLLEAHAGVVTVDIPTIERVGGGGVRCMLGEIHLPKR